MHDLTPFLSAFAESNNDDCSKSFSKDGKDGKDDCISACFATVTRVHS